MEKLEINSRDNDISAQLNAADMTVTFKNGKKYSLTNAGYAENAQASFDELDNVSLAAIEERILAKRNEQIREYAQWKGVKPDLVRNVKLRKYMENSYADVKNVISAPRSMLNGYLESIKRSIAGMKETDEAFSARIYDALCQTFTQNGMFTSYARACVEVDSGSEKFPKMYFYTFGEQRNGQEIWYKALDPIIWFGTLVAGKTAKTEKA